MSEENLQYKCGYCKWLINMHCDDLENHECFLHYDPALHEFVNDDDSYIYVVEKTASSEVPNEEQENHSPSTALGNLKWTHEAVLCLICLYEKHLNDFYSTKEKNDKVWRRLSLELIADGFTYTANQCKFKFKYLKAKYMQKKDNMKSTSTGEAHIKFRYFEEMDAIFGKKPNVVPASIASNLVKRNMLGADEQAISDNSEHDLDIATVPTCETGNSSKQKKIRISARSSIQKLIDEIKETSTIREAAKNKRHEENMQFKNKLLETFSSKMDLMIESLKNN